MNDPDEAILLEILIRLPAKSKDRFKCVSKRWNSLISHPYFVRRFIDQNNRASLPFALMFQYYKEGRTQLCITSDSQVFKSHGFSPSFLPCYQPEEKVPISVVESYNDLILCCSSSTNQNIVYYICNPITMQFVELPPAPQSDSVIFHFGFVYEPISDESGIECSRKINTTRYSCVIVRVPEFRGSVTKFKMEIFSSRTNEWSESYVSSHRDFIFSSNRRNSVFYKQILYWLCQPFGIFAFDVFGTQKNGCHFIKLPSNFKWNVYNNCMGVWQGRLRLSQLLVHRPQDAHLSTMRVWELEDYKSKKWRLEHEIFVNQMIPETPELEKGSKESVWNLAFHPNDPDLMYVYIPNYVVMYNMSLRTLKLASRDLHDKGYFFMNHLFLLKLQSSPTPVPTLLQNVTP